MVSTEETLIVEATMKSGAKVEFEVVTTTFSTTVTGGKQLEWKSPDSWVRKLLHLDMNEVAAIVVRKPARIPMPLPI